MQPRLAIAILFSAYVHSASAEPVPAALEPPSPTVLAGSFHAAGVQIYLCDTTRRWALEAPEAELSDAEGNKVIHHSAGPTWEANDGSKVVGKLLAKVPAPSGEAIPWLLLAATPSGSGLLGQVRYVQRLDTIGGVAPKSDCTAGETRRVPYTATYTFLR